MLTRRQVLHREGAARRIVAEDARHEFGNDRGHGAHPRDLPAVALHGGLPDGARFELGQRALHADRAARPIDAIDVGRDAARERDPRRAVAAADQPMRCSAAYSQAAGSPGEFFIPALSACGWTTITPPQ